MKQLLFIAYHFPPDAGAAAQRSRTFVEHLPKFGIRPVVLTELAERKGASAPLAGESELAVDALVARTPWPVGAHPSRRAAEERRTELALRLIEEHQLEAIYVSMAPFSDALFAARLSARCGIPWIADLRDPWALDEFQVYRTRWHRQRALRTMRRALLTASLIVMNTPEAAATLTDEFPEFRGRAVSITNGFDAAEFAGPGGARHPAFTIVYTGLLHSSAGVRQRRQPWQRMMGHIEPGIEILPRSPYYLLQALGAWREEDPRVDEQVRVLLAGEPRPIDRELVAHSPVAALTSFTGHLSHPATIQLIRQADLLFLSMHKLPPGRRATIVPTETFDYLATGRPILAPVPQGDVRNFLSQAGTGLICNPDDVGQMVAHLRRQFRAWLGGEQRVHVDADYVRRFEHAELTRQLAGRLHALTLAQPVPDASADQPLPAPAT